MGTDGSMGWITGPAGAIFAVATVAAAPAPGAWRREAGRIARIVTMSLCEWLREMRNRHPTGSIVAIPAAPEHWVPWTIKARGGVAAFALLVDHPLRWSDNANRGLHILSILFWPGRLSAPVWDLRLCLRGHRFMFLPPKEPD